MKGNNRKIDYDAAQALERIEKRRYMDVQTWTRAFVARTRDFIARTENIP
jgi:hypothetical protein